MAKEVASQLTAAQLESYGNIILNGYLEVVPNSINRKAWQYKETTTAPVNLPSLSETRPAIKGWTTNYYDYYTELPINAYGVNPGDPTMFEYDVHSFSLPSGPITSLGNLQAGSGYFTGSHTGIPAVGGSGAGATLDLVIGVGGIVTSVTLNNPGTGYQVGDGLTVSSLGPGTGFSVFVTVISPVAGTDGAPQWSQPPHRYNQQQVATTTPPQYVNNPAAIQYSFVYPVADNPVPPPIGTL